MDTLAHEINDERLEVDVFQVLNLNIVDAPKLRCVENPYLDLAPIESRHSYCVQVFLDRAINNVTK
jgi:hypothetical protein